MAVISNGKTLNPASRETPLIINGDMKVSQRDTSTTGIGADTAFVVDRFAYRKGGTPSFRSTISQSTTVPTGQGFLTSLKVDCTTADASLSASTRFGIDQKIEAQNLINLKQGTSSARATTLSFWVKSNLTGQFNIWIFKEDGTARSFVKAYTISSADTWEKKIINIDADTAAAGAIANDNGEGWRITWMLAAGSTFSSGSIATSWENYTAANIGVGQTNFGSSTDNEFFLTGVQLEVGTYDSTNLPDFPFESFDSNLRRCQRYFQIYMNAASANKDFFGGHIHDNDTFRMSLTFPVEFRTTPALTSSSSGSADHWRIVTSSINTNYGSAITFTGATKSGQFTLVDTGGTDMSSHVDDPGYMQNNQSSCFLKMDAEL